MNRFLILTVLVSFLAFTQINVVAQHHEKHQKNIHKKVVVKRSHYKKYPRTKVVVVKKRNPRFVRTLPAGYTNCVYRNRKFFFHNGFYYSSYNNGYRLVAAPRGIRIKVLPVGYRRIIMYNRPHFYYNGTFYREVNGEYESVEPEVGTTVPDIPLDIAEEVVVDNLSCYEIADLLYKKVETNEGTQYEIVGELEDKTTDL